MLDTLSSLWALGLLLLASYGVGQVAVRALDVDSDDWLAETVWSLAFGLVMWGLLLLSLGLASCLYRPLIGVLTCSSSLVAVGALVRRLYPSANERSSSPAGLPLCRPGGEFDRPPLWLIRLGLALSLMAGAGSLIGALAPSIDGDALCYHLDLPKLFLSRHAIFLPDFNDHGTFPLLVEMWYLWAMALDSGVAAQLVHWALGILLAAAGVLLARNVIGGWSVLVAPLVLLTPGISNQMAAPLNDVGLAFLTTLALSAWRRATLDDDGPRWFAACGIMLGAAASTKYTALLFAAALCGTAVWQLCQVRGRRLELLQGILVASVIAAAIAGPWYARAVWHRGNPVYPFFSQYLGESAPEALPQRKTPHGWDVASLVSIPWQMTMRPDRFGGRGHQLGALFLLALPGLAFARRLRGLGTLLLVAAIYFLFWYALRQNVRFLYPLVPLLSVAVVWVAMELRRFPPQPRWLAGVILGGTASLGAVVPLMRSADRLAVVVGWESRDAYLLRAEPSYAAASTANALLNPTDRLLSQDYRNFYFAGEVVREAVYRRATRYDEQLGDDLCLSQWLRAGGFTHLLLADARGSGIRFNQRLAELVAAEEAQTVGSRFKCLIDYEIADRDGAVRRYRLMQIR
jgi:hypothetical protein